MSRSASYPFVFVLLTAFLLSCFNILQPSVSYATDDSFSQLIENIDPSTEVKRTANSRHYRNPDGTITAYISLSDIHYKDEDGDYQLYDFTPHTSGEEGYGYEVTATDLQSLYSTDATGWIEVRTRDGFFYRWKELGMYHYSPTGLSTLLASPSHVQAAPSSNSIVYNGIYGSISNIISSSQGTVKHFYSLPSVPAQLEKYSDGYLVFTSFIELDSRLKMFANGNQIIATVSTSGAILLKSVAGDEIMEIPVPYALQEGFCTPGSNEMLSYKIVRDGTGYRFSVLTPVNYLKDSATSYPLFIDPTATLVTDQNPSDTSQQGFTYTTYYTGSSWSLYRYNSGGNSYQGAFVGMQPSNQVNPCHSMIVWNTSSINEYARVSSVATRLYESYDWSYSATSMVVDVYSLEENVFAAPYSVNPTISNSVPGIGTEEALYEDMGSGNQYGEGMFETFTTSTWFPGSSDWWNLGDDAPSDFQDNLGEGFFGLGLATIQSADAASATVATFAAYDDGYTVNRNFLQVIYEDKSIFTFDASYQNAVISIDGYVFESLPATYEVPFGARFMVAEDEIDVVYGQERYKFSHWFDGDTNSSRYLIFSADIDPDDTVIMAYYNYEYYLQINSTEGNIGGDAEGWYAEGTTINTYITGSTDETVDTRRLTIGWTAEGSAPETGNAIEVPAFIIDAFTIINWIWEVQYKLSVEGALSDHLGGGPGWYFRNQIMSGMGVFPYTEFTDGTRKYAAGWTGAGAVVDGSGNIIPDWTMSAPSVITWYYEIRYELGIESAYEGIVGDLADYYRPGSEVNTAVTPLIVDTENTNIRYQARSWTATGSLASGTGTEIPTFTITEPTYITWNWTIQYKLTILSTFGTVSPSNGTWFDQGTSLAITASVPDNDNTQIYAWLGWTGSGNGSVSDGNPTETITFNGPITQTANWNATFWLELDPGIGSFLENLSGWYSYGSEVVVQAIQPAAALDTKYILGWEGTGSGSVNIEPLESYSTVATISILAPIVQKASWVTNYRVRVRNTASFGDPEPAVGDYWVESGDTFYGSVIPNVSGMVCAGFAGTGSIVSGSLPIFSATITEPSTITWQWAEGEDIPLASWAESQIAAQGFAGKHIKVKLSADETVTAILFYSNELRQLRCHILAHGNWYTHVIAEGENVGTFSDIDIDSNNCPQIAYFNGVSKNICFDRFIQTQGTGIGYFVEEVIETGNYGRSLSLAINSQNKANIVYYDADLGDLRYLLDTDEGWLLNPIFSVDDIGYYCDIAITPLVDVPQVIFLNRTTNSLVYATYEDDTWNQEDIISSPNLFGPFSIKLDIGGRPYIGYKEYFFENTHNLYITWKDEEGWHHNLVINEETADGINYDFSIDTLGYIHIGYNNGEKLLYLRYNGITWDRVTLDLGPNIAWNIAMITDASENICLYYWHNNDLKVKHTANFSFNQTTYAELPAVEEIQRDEATIGGSSGCFVATAAFGSYATSSVVTLCSFRDSALNSSISGASLVTLYYELSPCPSEGIRESTAFRALVRRLLEN